MSSAENDPVRALVLFKLSNLSSRKCQSIHRVIQRAEGAQLTFATWSKPRHDGSVSVATTQCRMSRTSKEANNVNIFSMVVNAYEACLII